MRMEAVRLHDGRTLEFCRTGPEDAETLLVFHVGTPSAAVSFPQVAEAAAARGVHTVAYSRAGYEGSTRSAGRIVAQEAANTVALADHLGADSLLVAGWSGGGSAALACAALLPDRVRACAVIAGAAPPEEVGPAWFEWQAEEDRAELRALATGSPDPLRAGFEEAALSLAALTPEDLVGSPGTPDADREAFAGTPGFAEALVDSMRRGMSRGVDGWLDDETASARPWGFPVGDIRVPVMIRHGELDTMVRIEHGRWLADHVPDARAEFLPGGAHASVMAGFDDVMDDLLSAAN
ncbi:MAG TPA: alpha/beta hydrolase [Actinomycetota bacterium]|nr:alpha/beta hydrolase [Actinomycetota bacterium]